MVIDLSACNVCFRVPVVISQSLVSEPLPPDANTWPSGGNDTEQTEAKYLRGSSVERLF